jgi:hypothetical protein
MERLPFQNRSKSIAYEFRTEFPQSEGLKTNRQQRIRMSTTAARSPELQAPAPVVIADFSELGSPQRNLLAVDLAEGVGFEPTIRFPVYTLSKRAP